MYCLFLKGNDEDLQDWEMVYFILFSQSNIFSYIYIYEEIILLLKRQKGEDIKLEFKEHAVVIT